ncbi:MAG: substrate-binding domain-containing protein [Desulfovibrionales bacterium]
MAMAVFVSRSEDSGTHKKELTLWKAAGIAVPDELETYVKANKGMRETLELAAARKGYVLTDRGTLLSFQTEGGNADRLSILLEGSELLRNQYGIIALNPEKCAHANHDLAREFIDWITSEEGQSAIGNFRLQGHQLFSPNA